MSDISEPLTPADCDLRDFGWMPLDINALRRSKAWLTAKRNPALAFYMINLWTAAWHEFPAASLEDDDDMLCDLAMCDPTLWPSIRDQVLRGFIRCSDGRLYHPFVAAEAIKAWANKKAQKARTEAARAAKLKRREANVTGSEECGNNPPTDSVTESATDTVTKSVTEIVADFVTDLPQAPPDQTLPSKKESTSSLRSDAEASASRPPLPPDLRKEVFRTGIVVLGRLTGRRESGCRSLLAGWLRDAGDDPRLVMRAIHDAEAKQPAEPVSWIAAAIRTRKAGKERPATPCCNDGVDAWYHLADRAPDGSPKTEIREYQGITGPRALVAGSYLDVCADLVRNAARLPCDWRGDWETLCRWLRDGYELEEHIVPAIDRIAHRQGYAPPGKLAYFDQAIRQSRTEH